MFSQLSTLVLFFNHLTTWCLSHLFSLPVLKDSWSSPRNKRKNLIDLMLHLLYFVVLLKIIYRTKTLKTKQHVRKSDFKVCKEIKCFFFIKKKVRFLFSIFVAFIQQVNCLKALVVLPTSVILLLRRWRNYQIH